MKKNICIFTVFLVAMFMMPLSVWADIPENQTISSLQFVNMFCDTSMGAGLGCSKNTDDLFHCEKYKEEFYKDDPNGQHLRLVFRDFNRLLKLACDDDTKTILSNASHAVIEGNTITSITCKPGYMHPSGVSNSQFKCVSAEQMVKAQRQPSAPVTNTGTITITGTIVDENSEPLPGANVKLANKKGVGTVADINGNFKLENIPVGSVLEVSFIGFETQTIKAKEQINITLIVSNETLNEVVVSETHTEGAVCAPVDAEYAQYARGEYNERGNMRGRYKKINNKWKCVPTGCVQDYDLIGDTCVKQQCTAAQKKDINATEGDIKNGVCIATACIGDTDEYEIQNGTCVKVNCSKAEVSKFENADGGTWENGKCVPVCKADFGLDDKKTKCIKNECAQNALDAKKALAGVIKGGDCIPTKCKTDLGYTLNGTACEKTKCSKEEIEKLKKENNADDGEWKDGKCTPICKKKYHLDETKTCVKNKCDKDEEDWIDGECVKVRCTAVELAEKHAKDGKWDKEKGCVPTKCDEKIYTMKNGECRNIDERSDEQKKKDLEEKKKNYEDAKAKEQSTANKTLTALTTAATGIGGMQLMQGLAEQSADKDAAADMAAYLQTMRCSYGEGKSVKAGPDEIELPGGNNQELMKYRTEYIALAADLKERKNALGMKPGIESEEILDKASSDLYDDESIGITSGNYASLYRAQALGSEADQAKIDDAAAASKRRVTGGAIAAGAGVVVGVVGNSLINGKLGEALKNKKVGKETQALLKAEEKALDNLKSCLKSAGVQETDKLVFENFYPSVLSVKGIDCKKLVVKGTNGQLVKPTHLKAADMFADSTDEEEISEKMLQYFDLDTIAKMTGFSISNSDTAEKIRTNLENHIKQSVKSVQARFKEAEKKDKESAQKSGIDLSGITGSLGGDGEGLSSLASLFGGDALSSITGKLGSTTEQVEQ